MGGGALEELPSSQTREYEEPTGRGEAGHGDANRPTVQGRGDASDSKVDHPVWAGQRHWLPQARLPARAACYGP